MSSKGGQRVSWRGEEGAVEFEGVVDLLELGEIEVERVSAVDS